MDQCLTWASHWGVSVGIGLGGKVAVRFIQTVNMTSA